jgi:hypothetical protein
MQHIAAGYDMVINMACGLDTRPYRLPFPPQLKWVEIDLPGILDYKSTILENEKPNCQLRRIALDLNNRKERKKTFMHLSKESQKALVVTEGLMIYLTDYEVAELSLDLSDGICIPADGLSIWFLRIVGNGPEEMGPVLKEVMPTSSLPQPKEKIFYKVWLEGVRIQILPQGRVPIEQAFHR